MLLKNRDVFIDVAKAICMLLVVANHMEAFESIGGPLMFVAVPMFFFMSGMYDRSEKDIIEVVPKLLRTLLLPAIIWLVIGTMFSFFLNIIKSTMEGEGHELIFDINIPSKYNLPVWFLFALLYVKLLVLGLLKLEPRPMVLLGISVLLGYVGATYQMPMSIDEGLAATPFYCAGKYFYPYLNKLSKNIWLNIIGVLFFMTFILGPLSFFISPIGNHLYNCYFIIPMVGVLFAFIPLFSLSKKLVNVLFLQKFGQNTLGVLVVHLLLCMIMDRIAWRLFERGTMEWYILSFVFYLIVVMVSFYLSIIIKNHWPILLGIKKQMRKDS